jgi:hypothetical protein
MRHNFSPKRDVFEYNESNLFLTIHLGKEPATGGPNQLIKFEIGRGKFFLYMLIQGHYQQLTKKCC